MRSLRQFKTKFYKISCAACNNQLQAAYNFIMELTFNGIKKLDVVSVTDGKHFGKVCDVKFLWQENKILGFVVTGCKGFKFTRQEIFVPVCDIVKIGEDVILIKTRTDKNPCPPEKDKNCPPRQDFCPPPPNYCPPSNCAPNRDNRRSYDDYE